MAGGRSKRTWEQARDTETERWPACAADGEILSCLIVVWRMWGKSEDAVDGRVVSQVQIRDCHLWKFERDLTSPQIAIARHRHGRSQGIVEQQRESKADRYSPAWTGDDQSGKREKLQNFGAVARNQAEFTSREILEIKGNAPVARSGRAYTRSSVPSGHPVQSPRRSKLV